MSLDSGWQYGGEFDAIQPNPKFPDMKVMTDEILALGLKCGIYSTPMLTAWGCPKEYPSIPGCIQGEPDIRFSRTNKGIGVIRKETMPNNGKRGVLTISNTIRVPPKQKNNNFYLYNTSKFDIFQ